MLGRIGRLIACLDGFQGELTGIPSGTKTVFQMKYAAAS